MASFALEKLLCSEKITESLEITDARALALLGPTIGVPLHGQAHLNVTLTASHAALLLFRDLAICYDHGRGSQKASWDLQSLSLRLQDGEELRFFPGYKYIVIIRDMW